ncbi:HNH endonuclease [Vibrio phage D292]
MTQEEKDFEYFKLNQLTHFDPITGQLDVITKRNQRYSNVGSINPEGYARVWCNGRLRMRNRLVYWLVHGVVPEKGYEVDHIDFNRSNDAPSNLRILSKSDNNSHKKGTCPHGKQLTEEQVHSVCRMLADTNMSDQAIADSVGKSRSLIRDIKTRRRRIEIGSQYSWEHRVK